MKIHSTLKIALRALRRNIMRAFLTMLGIIIGVAAVIAMMEIGQGTSASIARTIANMGANNLIIFPGQAASGGISWGMGSNMTLTPDDCDAIAKECPAVSAAAPLVRTNGQVVYGNKNWVPQQILGSTAAYLDVRDWTDPAEGEVFTDRDVRNGNKVCVIGQTIATQLFENEDPVGKELRIKAISFKVVAVLRRKGANMVGQDQDDFILAPWTTIKYRLSNSSSSGSTAGSASSSGSSSQVNSLNDLYPQSTSEIYPALSAAQQADTPLPVRFANVNQIMAASRPGEMQEAMTQITQLLRQRHHLLPNDPDDFNIRDMTEMSNSLVEVNDTMTRLLLFVASISLVVGGVGIMNIMLVSVTERTREIGLRMAVGARSRDILQQFLVEALVLCLAGGIVGIMVGRGISLALRYLRNFPTATSVTAIVISVVVSASVGLIFGFYPAWKASRLDPIEALRYE